MLIDRRKYKEDLRGTIQGRTKRGFNQHIINRQQQKIERMFGGN